MRLSLPGLACGQTTMARIGLFARMNWPLLREPLGFHRDNPPDATTISRTLAGDPFSHRLIISEKVGLQGPPAHAGVLVGTVI